MDRQDTRSVEGGAVDGGAIVRGIHRIYPTLSALQLDAYIRELRTRRLGMY